MVYEFCMLLGEVELTDDLANRLFEAGCDDGSPGSCDGITTIDFHREADSLEAAIRSAVADVAKAGCQAKGVTIEPEALAAMAGSV